HHLGDRQHQLRCRAFLWSLDEKGPTMIRSLCFTILLFFTFAAKAHVGSPDVFYDGMVGPYPARLTLRLPSVVPGRAEISVRVQDAGPLDVSSLPLYSRTAVTNAPPPDTGH